MSPKYRIMYLIFITILILTACSSAPRQIAAFPMTTPIARYPIDSQIVYRDYLELRVIHVDVAADNAKHLASNYNGYLVSSQSWYVGERKVTTLELAVPTIYLDSFRYALCGLGELISGKISGRPEEINRYGQAYQWSFVTILLRPGRTALPVIEITGWNPFRTLQRAFSVFLTIFGFFTDVLIWIIVVAGPFMLLFLVGFLLARRFRGKK